MSVNEIVLKQYFSLRQKVELAVPVLETHNVNKIDSKRQESLDYLLKQAEVYSHFVTNGSKSKNTKRKAKTVAKT